MCTAYLTTELVICASCIDLGKFMFVYNYLSYSVMLSITKLFSNVYIDALPLQELPIDYPWVDVHYLQDVGLSMNALSRLARTNRGLSTSLQRLRSHLKNLTHVLLSPELGNAKYALNRITQTDCCLWSIS